MSLMEQSEHNLDQVVVFVLNSTILLGGVWVGDPVGDASILKMVTKWLEFTSSIRLEGPKLCVELSFDLSVK